MNDLENLNIYSYIKTILLNLESTTKSDYFKNTVVLDTIKYNKNLSKYTGLVIAKELMFKSDITPSLNNLEFYYFGRDYIDPFKIIIRKEQVFCVNKAFNTLPNNLKRIIDLHLFQEYDFLSIAKKFNDTIDNIINLYYLGISLVKYYFIKYYHYNSCCIKDYC